MKNLLLVLSTIIFLTSCERIAPNSWNLPPNKFYYQITENGVHLSSTDLDSLKFYYINENGTKVYRDQGTDNEAANHVLKPSWISGNESLDAEGVRLCMELNPFGVSHNTWYFEYPDGSIDTLYVESKEISKVEGRKDACYCTTPFSVVRLNGKDAFIHPTLKPVDNKPIWVLER